MSANTILILQSALIFLQMVNAAIGTTLQVPPMIAVLLAAFVGAFQFYINRLGNQIVPPSASEPRK